MILSEGETLADGRYTLVEHLGSGGMASVWLATDETLQREVAIKVMSDMLAGDERWLTRFRREARAAAALQHPNIVKVFDYGVEDGRPYLIMAYVAGGTLKERIAGGASIDAERLAKELLGALAHVHAAGLLHRDVKPGNVLLDAAGASHLTDFGIARHTDATELTQTGVVLGTMNYLAPEVAAGEPATARSDLYSAGRVLEEVGGLGTLTDRLTATDPSGRPSSAEAALAEMAGDTTAATAVLPERPRPSVIRAPWFMPVAAAAGIVLLAIIVVLLATGGGDGGAAPQVAPANAPLEQQLRQLDRAIDASRR